MQFWTQHSLQPPSSLVPSPQSWSPSLSRLTTSSYPNPYVHPTCHLWDLLQHHPASLLFFFSLIPTVPPKSSPSNGILAPCCIMLLSLPPRELPWRRPSTHTHLSLTPKVIWVVAEQGFRPWPLTYGPGLFHMPHPLHGAFIRLGSLSTPWRDEARDREAEMRSLVLMEGGPGQAGFWVMTESKRGHH